MSSDVLSQYLTFSLYKEKYAVTVSNVREVLEMVPVTRVPGMPSYMKGVLNLRGSVVPVVDLRLKFSLPEIENTIDTSIIILDISHEDGTALVGALVDSVQEVIDINAENIEPAPTLGNDINTDYIAGMYQHNNDFLIVLNIINVLRTEEIVKIPAVMAEKVLNAADK